MNINLKSLFSLVHSLTDEEKLFFSQRAYSKAPHLLPIYQSLNSSLIYRENTIREKLKAEYPSDLQSAIESTFWFTVNLLIESKSGKTAQLKLLTRSVNNLYKKKQYGLCITLLNEARKIATEYEMLLELDTILYFEQILAGYNVSGGRTAKTILADQLNIRKQLANLYRYSILNLKASEVEGSIIIKGKSRNSRLKQLLKDPLLRSEETAYSNESKLIYNSVKANIYYDLEEYQLAQKHYKRILEVYRSNPTYIKVNFYGYIAIANNFAGISIFIKRYEDALSIAAELKQLEEEFDFVKGFNLYDELQVRAYYIEMEVYVAQLQLDNAMAIVPKVEKHLFNSRTPVKILYKVGILYQIAEMLFILEKYSKTLKYIARLYEYDHPQLGVDMQTKGRLLELLIYEELGLTDQSREGIIFLKKYLKENKIQSRYITLFVDLIQLLSEETSESRKIIIYEEYLDLFTALKPSLSQQDAYFDIIPWLRSKLEKRKLLPILEEELGTPAQNNGTA